METIYVRYHGGNMGVMKETADELGIKNGEGITDLQFGKIAEAHLKSAKKAFAKSGEQLIGDLGDMRAHCDSDFNVSTVNAAIKWIQGDIERTCKDD